MDVTQSHFSLKMMYAMFAFLAVGQLINADLEQRLAQASVDFSQRMYQKLNFDRSDLVYSPFSIHSALSMALLGARGNTAAEMKNALGVTSLGDDVHLAYQNLNSQFNSQTKVQLHAVNAVFVNPLYQLATKFIGDAAEYYFATADYINTTADGGPEMPINDFVANKTNDMIKEVVKPGTIGGQTVMVLVNSVFFNGTWTKTFTKESTTLRDFHQLGGAVKQLEMMNDNNRRLKIKRDNANGVDVAELPFTGGRFSMYIVLPHEVDGSGSLEKMIARPGQINDLFTDLKFDNVRLAIPKFQIVSTFSLKSALEDLGMPEAFTHGLADFTGIIKEGELYISNILHKATIEVQETGTVASAATIVIATHSAQLPPNGQFIADHPFLFFLRDDQTSQILFQGKFSG